jgi:histidinol-phosphate phosphatase family protein
MKRAVFLDRDGVINKKAPEGKYVTSWEEMYILPGVPEAIKLINESQFLTIVVTNQRGIARGFMTIGDLDALHRRMNAELLDQGARIDRLYYCPHDYDPPCDCRKPKPGMLITAKNDLQIDMSRSWMVGDSEIDIAAGKSAGCKTSLIADNAQKPTFQADLTAENLLDAARQIVGLDNVSLERS